MTIHNAVKRLQRIGATITSDVFSAKPIRATLENGYVVGLPSQGDELQALPVYSPNRLDEPFAYCANLAQALRTADPSRTGLL